MKGQFIARINWLLNNILVAEGLPDAFRVRLDGKDIEGVYGLEGVLKVQSSHPAAHVDVRNAELDSVKPPSTAWAHVLPDPGIERLSKQLLTCACILAGVFAGSYVFTGNHGDWAKKLAWAMVIGLATASLAHPSLRYILGVLAWFCHLLCDHSRAFWRGAAMGALGGAVLGYFLWDFSDGILAGVLVTIMMGLAVGLLAGAARAQTDHEACSQKLAAREPHASKGEAPYATGRAVLTALFLTLITVQIPRHEAATDREASWGAVLNYAHQKSWQFGTDIVYTYGPLGFLTSHHYSASAVGFQMVAKTALSFAVALGVCFVAWRLPLFQKWVLLGLFIFFSGAIHAEGTAYAVTDLLMYVGLVCWGVLCLLESRRRLIVCSFCFVALSVLGTLVKISFILPAALGVAAVAGGLFVRGPRRLGLAIFFGYGLSVMTCWRLAGQRLEHFSSFLIQGFEIARGYHDAMCFEISPAVTWTAIFTACLAMGAIFVQLVRTFGGFGRRPNWHRMLLCGWLCCLLFVVWKYGIIRCGRAQLEIFMGFVPILALSMVALAESDKKLSAWPGRLALACSVMSLILLDTAFYRGFTSLCFCQPFPLLRWNLQCLLKPTEYWTSKTVSPVLPIISRVVGQATVDVFGCEQAYAILNDLNYRPRPVFQSMAAYTAPLMRLNEELYLSESAPEYIMFDLATIDNRFPPIEDSMVLRDILINYEPVEAEANFLLLKSRSAAAPSMRLISQGNAHPGERISMPANNDANLWVEIKMVPTLAGRLLRLLYKYPQVVLWVWKDATDSEGAPFLAPPPMLSAGFLASPLLLNTKAVQGFYGGSQTTRPAAYSIKIAPGTARFWQETFDYRVYRIDNHLGRRAPMTTSGHNSPEHVGQTPFRNFSE